MNYTRTASSTFDHSIVHPLFSLITGSASSLTPTSSLTKLTTDLVECHPRRNLLPRQPKSQVLMPTRLLRDRSLYNLKPSLHRPGILQHILILFLPGRTRVL